MGITFQLYHDRQTMDAVADGPVTFGDMRDHLLSERLKKGLTFAELIDGRTATPAFSSADVRAVVTMLRDFAREYRLGPTAVVVGSEEGFGMIRMLEILVGDVCKIHPFRDIESARKWLREA
jgi:hypothetical protein